MGYHRRSENLPEGILFDFDIWYNPTTENFSRVTDALSAIQPNNRKELKSIIFHPERAYLRITEKPFKLELLPEIKGYSKSEFYKVFKNAINYNLGKNQATIISYQDLIRSKLALARSVDAKDLEELRKINKK
ncbi:hypothetical protein [Fulvivirga ligni]|uniref:hypothetical protein n=1 Tax=Fulvivirga ligni TaxID=2904246 RepID=UPI001F3AA035|nr:hypothetical protein [Fulvivirga ligni]UII19118.1 hypothetical protein LVD16_14835 [Fulvivirga ligni]